MAPPASKPRVKEAQRLALEGLDGRESKGSSLSSIVAIELSRDKREEERALESFGRAMTSGLVGREKAKSAK